LIKFKSTKYKYGERERGRSTSLLLSKELKEKMDEVCGGEGQRSSWAERWLRLAVAVQEEDEEGVDEWVEWAKKELSPADIMRMAVAMDCIAHGLDRWV